MFFRGCHWQRNRRRNCRSPLPDVRHRERASGLRPARPEEHPFLLLRMLHHRQRFQHRNSHQGQEFQLDRRGRACFAEILLDTAINRDSYAFMRGRDKPLAPNTAWTINAEIAANTTAAGYVYVLLEIEYPDVQGFDAEDLKGSPSSSSARTHPLPELPTPSFPSERSTISSRELSTYFRGLRAYGIPG